MLRKFFVLAASNGGNKKIKCFIKSDKFDEARAACVKKGIGYSGMEFTIYYEVVVELQPERYYNKGNSGFSLKQVEKTVCKVAEHILGREAVINWPDDVPEWSTIPVQFCRKQILTRM